MTRSRFTLASVRRITGLALSSVLLAGITAGCAVSGGISAPVSAVTSSTDAGAGGQRIVLRFDHAVVTATLSDTAAGREFAALLPLTLDLRDPMGQAKSGHLRTPLTASDAAMVTDPEVGGFYYVPDSQMVAVFNDDLAQSVPSPGLIRLGTVTGDLTAIGAAGNRVRVRVDVADATST